MNNKIYIIVGALFVVYLLITMSNKRRSNKRKSKKFMEDYSRKDKEDKN